MIQSKFYNLLFRSPLFGHFLLKKNLSNPSKTLRAQMLIEETTTTTTATAMTTTTTTTTTPTVELKHAIWISYQFICSSLLFRIQLFSCFCSVSFLFCLLFSSIFLRLQFSSQFKKESNRKRLLPPDCGTRSHHSLKLY